MNGVERTFANRGACDVIMHSRPFDSHTLPTRAFHRNRSFDNMLRHDDVMTTGHSSHDQHRLPSRGNSPEKAATLSRQHSLGGYVTTPGARSTSEPQHANRKAPTLPERRTAYKEEYAVRGRSKDSQDASPKMFYSRPNKTVRHADV